MAAKHDANDENDKNLMNTEQSPELNELTATRAVENFLKAVYVLQQRGNGDRVSTNDLSKALNISPPSVTDMARRMDEAGWVDYKKYRGVLLTHKGEVIALRTLRRHRLIELYLVEELGYALHEVHSEAEELEHTVSERFVDAIAHKLGNPQVDPHGDPIPAADGTIVRADTVPLLELEQGVTAQVNRFTSDNPEMLQHILDRDFALGVQVIILNKDPFDGPITVRINETQQVIGPNVAARILVIPLTTQTDS